MVTVGVHEAKSNLSRLLRLVDAGEEVLITRNGEVAARLVPPAPSEDQPEFGIDVGAIHISDDFDAPLPEDLLDVFGA